MDDCTRSFCYISQGAFLTFNLLIIVVCCYGSLTCYSLLPFWTKLIWIIATASLCHCSHAATLNTFTLHWKSICSTLLLESLVWFPLCLQLRDSIAQDQEKSDALKTQMEDLKTNIQTVENKITRTETSIVELRKLQEQISIKATARSTYFTLQQQQYAALSEENEGKQLLIILNA